MCRKSEIVKFLPDKFCSLFFSTGKPPPRVTWWANDTLLDGVVDTGRSALTAVNQLVIPKAPRSLRGSRLECRASSMEIAGDIVREVPIIIFCKLTITIFRLQYLCGVRRYLGTCCAKL